MQGLALQSEIFILMKSGKKKNFTIDDLAFAVGRGFNMVDKRFNAMDKRFGEIDGRFNTVDKKLFEINQRLEITDKRIANRFSAVFGF
mgnify:FL=1